jgi:hypothetical protein
MNKQFEELHAKTDIRVINRIGLPEDFKTALREINEDLRKQINDFRHKNRDSMVALHLQDLQPEKRAQLFKGIPKFIKVMINGVSRSFKFVPRSTEHENDTTRWQDAYERLAEKRQILNDTLERMRK